jgi:hypothetical protein
MTSPDRLEPFTVSACLRGRFDDPAALVGTLLEDVAGACELAGASVIGHLKGRARTPQGSFHCNLVSLRSGPRCAGHLAEAPAVADAIDLDLAVLVYGLPHDVIASTVEEAFERLRGGGLTAWAVTGGPTPASGDCHSSGLDEARPVERAPSCDNNHSLDHGHPCGHEHIPNR